jgi:Rod binding domain-containing protein
MSSISAMTTNPLKAYAAEATPEQKEQLQTRIRELVGQVFFGTMLQQMRSTMDSSNPLNGGKAGQTYARQLDQELIARLSSSTNFEIGQKMAEQWTGQSTARNEKSTAKYGLNSSETTSASQELNTWI